MRKSLLLLIISVVALVLKSCAPDPVYSYPPEFKKPLLFTLDDPNSVVFNNQNNLETVTFCKPGDIVTVYLPTEFTGVNIYKTIYEWTSNSDLLEPKTITQIAPCKQDSLPPKWTFVAPRIPGRYEVYFRASFFYSAQTEKGEIYGGYPASSGVHGYQGASSVSATLIVKE